jgi:hypothetical protein
MLLHQAEARAFLESVTDERVQGLLQSAVTEVFLTADGSEVDFDMLFFLRVLADLFSNPYIKAEKIKGDDNVIFSW